MKQIYSYNVKQLEAINSTEPKLVIIAPPGSGKTFTMTGAIEKFIQNNNPKKVVVVTFTNKAADELKERLFDYSKIIHTSTIHSWSYSELKKLSEKHSFRIRLLEEEQIKMIIKPHMEQYAINMRNIDYVYQHCMGNVNPDLPSYLKSKYDAVYSHYVDFKRKKYLYDFTDLPLYLKTKLEDYNEYIEIDGLFVDEFQDVDPIQLTVFNRVIATKKFFIGDPHQCQPAGTKIRMSDGTQKNIEDIEVGDRVVSYYKSESYISGTKRSEGFKVLEKGERLFHGDYLISVTSENGKTSKYTPNHKTFAAIRSDNEYNHLVYLMEDVNHRFRIGISQFYANYGGQQVSTFRHKLICENYINAWVLKVTKTEKEARVYENKYSYQFQIPQITFQLDKSTYTNEDIELIYKDLNIRDNAKKLLSYLLLDINYPFLSKNDNLDFRRDAFREFYAINLIPEVMSILTHDSTKASTKRLNRIPSKLIKVEKTWIYEPIIVYSLKIDVHETYVADDIVTHNSIYIFRGATEEIFNQLSDFKVYNLNINYRSYQVILDFATCFKNQRPRTIQYTYNNKGSSIIAERGNGGLVLQELHANNMLKYEVSRHNELNVKAMDSILKEFNNYNYQILCRTNKQVRELQKNGFHNISTIHKAKGLEYDNVVVVDFEIESDEDLNVGFVALTRAKDRMMILKFETLLLAPDYIDKSKLISPDLKTAF